MIKHLRITKALLIDRYHKIKEYIDKFTQASDFIQGIIFVIKFIYHIIIIVSLFTAWTKIPDTCSLQKKTNNLINRINNLEVLLKVNDSPSVSPSFKLIFKTQTNVILSNFVFPKITNFKGE